MRSLGFVVLAGCGRVAFDPLAGDAASDAENADVAGDAGPSHLLLDFEMDADPRHDSGPGQRDATCTECPTAAVDPTRGMVAMFGGTTCLRIADAPELRPAKFTVTAWANYAGAISEILSRPLDGQTNVSNSFELYIDTGGPVFFANNQPRFGSPVPQDEWHHVAGVFDGNMNVLYVDGVDVTGPATAGAVSYGNDAIFVGCDLDVGTEVQWFSGKLDAVRLYDLALAPAEVVADKNR